MDFNIKYIFKLRCNRVCNGPVCYTAAEMNFLYGCINEMPRSAMIGNNRKNKPEGISEHGVGVKPKHKFYALFIRKPYNLYL